MVSGKLVLDNDAAQIACAVRFVRAGVECFIST
jgi:hypothetical protein